MNTMKWTLVDDYMVVVSETGRPDDQDFGSWLQGYAEVAERLLGLFFYSRAASGDSSLDAAQRAQLITVLKGKRIRRGAVVVTDSEEGRYVATALNSFLPADAGFGRVFATKDLPDALHSLTRSEPVRRQVSCALLGLVDELRNHPLR